MAVWRRWKWKSFWRIWNIKDIPRWKKRSPKKDMPTISIPNQTIYYAARGQHGAPLVFIHGAGDNHLLWNDALVAAANASRAYALDLPGHGRSSGSGCATILDYANVVREFLDAAEIARAIFVGISMGGAIAQTLALEFPTRVLGLGLVGTGA
ncbi:alpha/beta fold hydrolase, partial [Anaerolineae bacterium CFX7]|nr:alpha/beta fold hydrolase [Anaerolineae bacterium CFX7]